MKLKNILTGFIILVIVVSGILILKKRVNQNKNLPTTAPSVQEQIESKFTNLKIPAGENIELRDVSGGEGMGIATKTEIIADLPKPITGKNYQAYAVNSSDKKIFLGNLIQKKGGYILEYSLSKYPGFNKIVISLGGISILEGSF